jgi:hypothetical protein
LNKARQHVRVDILLASIGFLSACASTNWQSMQRAPSFQATRIHKVLVVCISQKPGVRSRWEKEFVRQWQTRGVGAVASEDVLPAGVTLDKVGVAPFAKVQGFDHVLVMRLVKREKIVAETPEDHPLSPYVDAIVAAPNEPVDFEEAIVSTKLFDVVTEMPVWSATSETLLTGDAIRRARPFVKDILSHIY